MKFRYLTSDEVEARVSTVTEKGISLLLYKDARCDMRVLDETVGAENWQREHYECKGNLFCRVGIKTGATERPDNAKDLVFGKTEWVWKSDCGTESYTEKEKGEASDSFKRACFNWGIGRELYTAPFVWVPKEGKDGKPNYDVNEKNQPKDRFAVTYMEVKDGKITALNIENTRKRRTVFVYGNIIPGADLACCICSKPVTADFAEKSKAANGGKVYCSGTCKGKADAAKV